LKKETIDVLLLHFKSIQDVEFQIQDCVTNQIEGEPRDLVVLAIWQTPHAHGRDFYPFSMLVRSKTCIDLEKEQTRLEVSP